MSGDAGGGFDCFNTQPPEGGWDAGSRQSDARKRFNTQPPEGGWEMFEQDTGWEFGFNTQPPEGGWGNAFTEKGDLMVSTHSRLKAAGMIIPTQF